MKKIMLVNLFFTFFVGEAYAYKWIEYENDKSFYGECDQGGAFSGLMDSEGYYVVSGPQVAGASSKSRVEAIKKACFVNNTKKQKSAVKNGNLAFQIRTEDSINVSNFDIKGIKLGMDISTVKKILDCSAKKTPDYVTGATQHIHGFSLRCDNIDMNFDHNLKLHHVLIEFKFNQPPNINNIIKNDILKKYGNPKDVSTNSQNVTLRYDDDIASMQVNFFINKNGLLEGMNIALNHILLLKKKDERANALLGI